MSVSVRRASSDDATAIARIAESSFGDPFDQEGIRRLLQAGRNYTLVALDAGSVVGFADNFVTVSGTGDQRLELDLLAVEPQAQGKGIGRRLIAESILVGRALGLPLLRALVSTENLVMRGLCSSHAFVISEESYDLHVVSARPGTGKPGVTSEVHLVPVETLAYSGIWIEGCVTPSGILQALSMASARQMETVGVLIRQSDPGAVRLLADHGFKAIGTYDWWSLNLRID